MAVEVRAMPAFRYIVRGRVQGVGFRDFVRGAARRAGVTGWVRNRVDGTVEAFAVGSEEAQRELERALREGPRRSRVDEVQVASLGEQEPPTRFDITS